MSAGKAKQLNQQGGQYAALFISLSAHNILEEERSAKLEIWIATFPLQNNAVIYCTLFYMKYTLQGKMYSRSDTYIVAVSEV